ncbi:MAG TPA: carboxylesterase family protein [Bryobacteraceae bacterium]|jgi:para-nitrobenzyl esterase|nr:carboxylesterase family protein [Bryobacteraceae bacterium]
MFARFSVAFLLTASLYAAIDAPVKLDSGLVSGITGTNPDIRVFKGIPFAAPPVGNLRWRAPQAVAHWDGVRKGDEFGPICMQAAGRGGRGGAAPKMSEDCLYLNVWTAAKTASERRPVLLWIHPGGYTSGSGSSPATDGEALAKKGVVVVTINYRLGVLGFFAHPELTKESDGRASGNYALMDQTAALEWVQKNIAGFGGDPKRVTVDGDSAGAASIGNLMGSPRTKGLFQRAIAESGAWIGLSVGHTATLSEAEQAGLKTGENLGAPTLADLRAKPAADVLKGGRGGGPIIDGYFLPEDVGKVFAEGRQNDVPVLLGSNKDEGTFFMQPTTAAKFIEQAHRRYGDQADAFLKLYPATSDEEANASQLAAFRDELGWVMRNWASLQTKTGKSKAYLYYFTHEPPAPAGASPRGGFGSGATHGAEAAYVFENLLPPRPWTDLDRQVADTLSSYWVNFATNGNPNGKGLPAWPVYSDKKNDRMVLGDKAEVGPGLTPDRAAFYQMKYDKRDQRQ